MSLDEEIDKAINKVIPNYKDDDWIGEIKKRVPTAEAQVIQEYIMIYFGGDVIAIDG